MAKQMKDLSRSLQRTSKRIQAGVTKVARTVALVIDQTLVMSTPVDVSRARSNWVVSIGAPVLSPREAYFPGASGSTKSESSQAALTQGEAEIGRYSGREGEKIYIANGLDYIGSLNRGSSPQANAGFVEDAIQAGLGAVAGAKVLRGDS